MKENGNPMSDHLQPKSNLFLCIATLGIVFGDLGTSILYAFKTAIESISKTPTEIECLGVLSLIFWSLLITISLKYMIFVLKADNQGEGGILALLALVVPWNANGPQRNSGFLLTIGLFGSVLLLGDSVITPAISVMSAIEGLDIITKSFSDYTKPITILILILLFSLQYKGTTYIGKFFGPIMVLWFATTGFLGLIQIIHTPIVINAINPWYAYYILTNDIYIGFTIMGLVFLAVTGGEACFSDLGHFGRKPIQMAWTFIVLPSAILNYAGQTAIVISDPTSISNPFYHLAPDWFMIPLVLLATCATIIASQALISGSFSLTRQACSMNIFPRIKTFQTSSTGYGQIYIPIVNYTLLFAVIIIVMTFKDADSLAGAYGIAVSMTMGITTILLYRVMTNIWQWSKWFVIPIISVFLTIDTIFCISNMSKIFEGGWVPLTMAAIIYYLIKIWGKGSYIVQKRLNTMAVPVEYFTLASQSIHRVPGTAVFLSKEHTNISPILLQHITKNKVLHKNIIILSIITAKIPKVSAKDRLTIYKLDETIWRVQANYGFVQSPSVPVLIASLEKLGLPCDPDKVTYYVGRDHIVGNENVHLRGIEQFLFVFMSNNAAQASDYFKIPEKQAVEFGIRIEV